MKRLHLTAFTALGSALLATPTLLARNPNIVFIMTDQQTATAMSCAGNPDLKTPNMDKLAEEGVRFTNAYCAAPLSTPSRAAMFTGFTPSATNQTVNNSPIPDAVLPYSLGMLVKKAGYNCAYAGKWHLPTAAIEGEKFGFKKLYGHNDVGLAESVETFLKQKHDKPFFLVVAIDNPHNICEYARAQPLPFATITEPSIEQCPNLPTNYNIAPYDADVIREEQRISYKKYPVVNYSNDDWRRYRNTYYRLVELADEHVGKVMNNLKNNGLLENTIVIFTSDHGDGNGSHRWNQKSALYEEVVNIPLIVRLPKTQNINSVQSQLINNGIDIFATVCDYAGAEIPKDCLGKSLRSVLNKVNAPEIHPYVVTETQFDASTTRGWMVRSARYKYVIYDKGRYREQLYDMENDRGEMINLAIQNKYNTILQQHREMLENWKKENKLE